MSHESAGRIAREFWDAISAGNVDGAFSLVAEDAAVEIPPAGLLGTSSEDGRAFFAETATAFPDLLLTVRRSFATADGTVVTEMKVEGTQAADYLGAINQEKHLDVDQVWLLRVDGEKIRAITGYWDQNMLYRRLAVKRLDHVSIV